MRECAAVEHHFKAVRLNSGDRPPEYLAGKRKRYVETQTVVQNLNRPKAFAASLRMSIFKSHC